MRIVLCDDDSNVLENLLKYLRQFFSDSKLSQPEFATYTSGEELLEKESSVDIAFLDVEMPGLSGIHVGAKLQKQNRFAKIIILTSYPDYLDEAMKFHVFRYLSKPIDKNRLFRNMKDALFQLSIDTKPIIIETKQGYFTRLADELVMVETAGRNVVVHSVNCDYVSVQPIKYWYSLTDMSSFFQPHHSFVVNMKYVKSFSSNTITLKFPPNGTLTAFLTRRRYQAFKNAYMVYLEAMM